ncbi:hypothetical protein GCM10022246_38990 [Pedobacter ginsengiterrae]|uniref:Uncharacterized protein n=2 Tax=Sphingobacteriaceae TaxID=84566 RepID=A0ABP7QLM0_9SPHI
MSLVSTIETRLFCAIKTKVKISCLNIINLKPMNVKRTFGTILTILGVIALIYAGYGFVNHSQQTRGLMVYGIIGLLFFLSGIGLVKNTKDEV